MAKRVSTLCTALLMAALLAGCKEKPVRVYYASKDEIPEIKRGIQYEELPVDEPPPEEEDVILSPFIPFEEPQKTDK